MPTTNQPLMQQLYSNPFIIVLVYSTLIWWMVCPSQFNIATDLIGYLGSDTIDTLSLRWAFWNPDAHFFPVGWDAVQVTPNFIDHLLFRPLLMLPFPLADNLWWLLNLLLSMIAAHAFGLRINTDSNTSGWLAGFSLLCGDTILRDLNWGHAPQIMWWAPLFCLTYLSKWKSEQQRKWLLLSGIWLGVSGFCYFYFVPFVLLITIPFWIEHSTKNGLQWFGTAFVTLIPNLFALYILSSEMIPTPTPPLISGMSLTDIHSATLETLWTGTPIDISNLWSLIWIGAVTWGGFNIRRTHPVYFRMGMWSMVLAFVLVLGNNGFVFPILKQFPFFSRLLWPERFGMIFLIGGIYWIVHQPKVLWLLPFMLFEIHIRSENSPIHTEPMSQWQCLRILEQNTGAIVELPLKNGDGLYNQQSLRQRFHKRPLLNPFILPPFVSPPNQWESIQQRADIKAIDGFSELTQEHVDSLLTLGIQTILMDTVKLSSQNQIQIQHHLAPILSSPIDLGCAKVWVLDSSIIQPHTNVTPIERVLEPQHNLKSTQQPWYINP